MDAKTGPALIMDNMAIRLFNIISLLNGIWCYNPVFIEVNPSNLTTELNVTAYTGTNQGHIRIVQEQATWFEAYYKCQQRGFSKLSNLRPGAFKMRAISQTIWEEGSYSTKNATFWIGIFRPYLILDRWFRANNNNINPSCTEYTTSQIIDVTTENNDQCAYVSYSSVNSKSDMISHNCSRKLHYLCYEWISNGTEYYVYHGFDVMSLSKLMSVVEMNETDFNNCSYNCTEKYNFAGFTFYNETTNCTLFILDVNYNYITYTIQRISQNVTHFVKNGSHFDVTDTTIVLDKRENELVFPACIPTGYCVETEKPEEEPINVTQLEESTAEIVNSLTIDPDETAKGKQRLQCATDDRTSAKAVGGVSVVVIAVVCSIPLIIDVINVWKYLVEKQGNAPSSFAEVEHLYH